MTADKSAIEGVSLFSITPVGDDGFIDFNKWARHIDFAIGAGIHTITLFGSTGANGYFTEGEKQEALTKVAAHVAGRVPVMFGIGAMTTAESVRLAAFASANGADAVLVVPLNYWKPTEEELLDHYAAVGEASQIPVWVYNNPGLAGIDLKPDFMAKVSARVPNIVGMKDSSGDLTRVWTVPRVSEGRVKVGLGQDTLALEPVMGPAPAWFTGLANFCPAECVAFWNAAKGGDAAAAFALSQRLFEVSEIGGRYGIIRVAHTGLELIGRDLGGPRRPLAKLTGAAKAELAAAISRAGIA